MFCHRCAEKKSFCDIFLRVYRREPTEHQTGLGNLYLYIAFVRIRSTASMTEREAYLYILPMQYLRGDEYRIEICEIPRSVQRFEIFRLFQTFRIPFGNKICSWLEAVFACVFGIEEDCFFHLNSPCNYISIESGSSSSGSRLGATASDVLIISLIFLLLSAESAPSAERYVLIISLGVIRLCAPLWESIL